MLGPLIGELGMCSDEKQPRETVQEEQKCASHLKYARKSFYANLRN